jgi:hypothetical protein
MPKSQLAETGETNLLRKLPQRQLVIYKRSDLLHAAEWNCLDALLREGSGLHQAAWDEAIRSTKQQTTGTVNGDMIINIYCSFRIARS